MKNRIRTPFAIALLLCLAVLLNTSPAGATTHVTSHTSQKAAFASQGQGHASAKKVSTDTVAQVKSSGQGAAPMRQGPGGPALHLSPGHVTQAPTPPTTDLSVKSSFEGISDDGYYPSDSNGAGGLKNYIEAVNTQFEVYSRTGTKQYNTDFHTWFNYSNYLTDPHVVWDDWGSRFIMLIQTNSSILLTVAQQTSGLGNYCNYSFNTLSGYSPDYPELGVDYNGIYFTINLYPSSGAVISELFYIPRTASESCQGFNYNYYWGLTNPDGSYAFTVVPAVQHSYPGNVEYLVNSYWYGACQLTLWNLTSDGTLTRSTVNTQCYSPPPVAKQKGSSGTIEVFDSRLYHVSYLNGLVNVSTVGQHDWGDGNGNVGIVEWFRINPSTSSISSQGSFGTPGYWLFFPEMDVTDNNHILFSYNASGPNSYVNVWAISGCLCDTFALATGNSYYGTSGTGRWGDFASAWLDPKYSTSGIRNAIYITGQYARATNSWGTRAARIVPHA
ncbi:MAG TPA: hypothetical protein VFQ30_00680 [Ktedonobacteraceae bacterium]|nr:hypothetical protein [Ktedonobacteraceae bacterium]